MEISWRVFFVMWAVTIITASFSGLATGGGMIGLAAIATVMRLVGYERGWRLFTVMPFIGHVFMAILLIGHR